MQNQFVFSAGKSIVGHLFSGGIVKSLGVQQQRNALPRLTNDLQSRNLSDNRGNVPLLLPGGGLGKLQGSFKEEQYFNIHEHMLVAQLQQSGYRLKCESSMNANWKEFERMANDLTQLTAVRQSGQLCKYKNCPEESFFLQEQRSLLERIIDALRRLFSNSGSGTSMPPPYGGGYYPYGPQYHNSQDEKKVEEQSNENEKSLDDDDDDANKPAANEEEEDKTDKSTEEIEENKNFDEEKTFDNPPHNGFGARNNGRGDEHGRD